MQDSTARSRCVRTFISGRVQGVGFRASTVQKAQKLGLNGWVRNLSDGRVEAIFEGKNTTVEEMLAWCQEGPPTAVVDKVEVEEVEPTGIQGFEARYS